MGHPVYFSGFRITSSKGFVIRNKRCSFFRYQAQKDLGTRSQTLFRNFLKEVPKNLKDFLAGGYHLQLRKIFVPRLRYPPAGKFLKILKKLFSKSFLSRVWGRAPRSSPSHRSTVITCSARPLESQTAQREVASQVLPQDAYSIRRTGTPSFTGSATQTFASGISGQAAG